VDDVVRANLLAFESDRRGAIFNVGTGDTISIKELADIISPNQLHEARRKGDAEVTLADITRIRAELGWEPTVPIVEGIRAMMARVEAGLE
jgi:UDP-glucose 4-epimerase